MFKPFAALFLAASAVYASAEPVVEAYEILLSSLEAEVVALETVQQASDAAGVVASVQNALNTQQQLRESLRGEGEIYMPFLAHLLEQIGVFCGARIYFA